ncbi:MAG: hypothetical protein GY773_02060, partial [Actinomycetia bacterium]|nr:hypothetical protein [Actinomycetes bacterium]
MAGQMDMIIRGGTVVTPGLEGQLDIGISDGEVAQLGGAMTASTEIDASGR